MMARRGRCSMAVGDGPGCTIRLLLRELARRCGSAVLPAPRPTNLPRVRMILRPSVPKAAQQRLGSLAEIRTSTLFEFTPLLPLLLSSSPAGQAVFSIGFSSPDEAGGTRDHLVFDADEAGAQLIAISPAATATSISISQSAQGATVQTPASAVGPRADGSYNHCSHSRSHGHCHRRHRRLCRSEYAAVFTAGAAT